MATEKVIRIEHVAKTFKLPHEQSNSIKSGFTGIFKTKQSGFELQHALKSISFEVNQGEFFGIVGRNGSGKSTLLKIIAGIYKPSQGTVKVHGRLVPFIELGVGFNPELTGRENVFLNGALLGFNRREIARKYESIVEFAELERFMDQKLKNYSSGMQVRLAFSVATVLAESDILLIDEVLAVGDADFQRKCFEYFRELKKKGKTVVFVSHDMNAVREYCDRAILVEGGEIVSAGSSDSVAKEYNRLFVPKQGDDGDNNSANKDGKWGNGKADITSIKHKKSITEEDSYIDITYAFTIKDKLEGVVVGFAIKNQVGQSICGTNSLIVKDKHLKTITSGSHKVTWRVPNIFNDGRYYVEPAISQADNMDVCVWWDEASEFSVTNEYRTPYITSPKIELL